MTRYQKIQLCLYFVKATKVIPAIIFAIINIHIFDQKYSDIWRVQTTASQMNEH